MAQPKSSFLGIDIGGTKILAAVVAPDGTAGPQVRVATPARDGPRAVLEAAISAGRSALTEHARAASGSVAGVSACGVGTAGTVGASGVITYATDTLPGWAGTDVRTAVALALGMPAVVMNDVHAAAMGEHAHGAAANHGTALVVWIGTGIGGAIVRGGSVVIGRTSTAGAVGHVPIPQGAIKDDMQQCTCGSWGHLEAYASGPAIARRYQRVASARSSRNCADQQPGLRGIATLARTGDAVAIEVIEQAGAAIGSVLGGLANVLDPDVIVIGGGVSSLADLLEASVRHELAVQALPGPAGVELAFSALGPMAVVVGAAAAARSGLVQSELSRTRNRG